MNELGRRHNTIIVKNLPGSYGESQLKELFSKFGHITSSKVLPSNPNFDGGCAFINYEDSDSCSKAIESMNNVTIDRFTLRVHYSLTRTAGNTDRLQNSLRTNGETPEISNRPTSVSVPSRFNGGLRSNGTHSPDYMIRLKPENTSMNISESEVILNSSTKPLRNSTNIEQQMERNSCRQEIVVMNVREHDSLIINKTYCVYLSNLEVPNIIYAATLDDYVNATLLITQMSKHEQLMKTQSNTYKLKLGIGQYCAALFNGDWYRARVLEVEGHRVHVQYIDWGNTGWCDVTLEIRPLPNEYYKESVLSVKCIVDAIPTGVKLSEEQTNAILEILVLDAKIDMTVVRIENDVPYVQLNIGKRNLNTEICKILSQSLRLKTPQICINETISFDSYKPKINSSVVYSVQLTTVDGEPECFHLLILGDSLSNVMSVLKDWNDSQQPLTTEPKPNMLVCAQYDGDDLWYRAWIKNISEAGLHVRFVDFGNEEYISIDRLSECPDSLRQIPWQSIQIKLANIKLTVEERFALLRDFETSRLDMKILSKEQDIYSVELFHDGKALSEHVFESRLKNEQQKQEKSKAEQALKESIEVFQQIAPRLLTPAVPIEQQVPRTVHETLLPVQTAVDELKRFVEVGQCKIGSLLPSPMSNNTVNKEINPVCCSEQIFNNSNFDENFNSMIAEQRRQNRLIEQVIAAINTTNALLTQLVQR